MRGGVLHVVPAAFDEETGVLGGAERYALELARTMSLLVPTTLLAFGDRPCRRRDGELEIVVERARAVRGQKQNPWSPALVRWLLRADVVHCHQRSVLASSTSALLGRIVRKPVFVTDLGGGGWDVSAFVDTFSWYAGHLHISEFSRRVFGHAGRSRATVIGGGVDTEKFSPDPAVRRDGSVLYVGRLVPHKGVNYLVEAADERMPVRIVGVPYDARFHADLRSLAAGKRVEFVGAVDDETLVQEYRRASVVVLPSVHRTLYGDTTPVPELLGQTALEAMACGAPVVCTDVASLPEVVADGETGLLVPPNDPARLREKIAWLLEHADAAAAMGAAGRKRVLERFSWPSVARRCLAIYGLARERVASS